MRRCLREQENMQSSSRGFFNPDTNPLKNIFKPSWPVLQGPLRAWISYTAPRTLFQKDGSAMTSRWDLRNGQPERRCLFFGETPFQQMWCPFPKTMGLELRFTCWNLGFGTPEGIFGYSKGKEIIYKERWLL